MPPRLRTAAAPNAPCPCGRDVKYKRCCGPLHRGVPAPTALALMRSRYAAYALGLADYIVATTHPDSPHREPDLAPWLAGIVAFCHGTDFLGLEILETSAAGDPDEAYVTFHARLASGGEDCSFSERSRFRRVDQRWLYVDGAVTPP